MTGVGTAYDRVSRINHWVVALLMIGMLILGIYVFKVLPRGPDKGALIGLHKSIGLLVLVLGSWRVAWRLKQGFLAALHSGWQEKLANLVHWVLLAGIVVMPLSGLAGSYFGGRATGFFGLFTIPAGPKIGWIDSLAHGVHGAFAMIMIAAILLHVLGALKHALIDRDATKARMTGRG
ncbi:cytochrome b [Shimia sp.]|uniref:cytochrome b n=1 Tax=Shimia sp. TaxID=1954381 RepID=UPI0032969E76